MSSATGNKPVSKRDYAYMELKDLIQSGDLQPGERLILRPLAERLNLSIMPVRDALRDLELEGLIEVHDHKGAYVAKISREEVLQCVSVRMWLEVYAVVQAAQRRDVESMEAAARALSAGEQAIKAGDGEAFTVSNRSFHEAVESQTDELSAGMIKDLWNRLWQVRRRSSLFVLAPHTMEDAQHEHEDILRAVAAGDAEAAQRAAEAHRLRTLSAWEAALPQ